MKYISSTDAAKVMEVSSRYVIRQCKEGRIEGAYKDGRTWKIPEASVSPKPKRGQNVLSDTDLLPCGIGKSSYIEMSSECYYVDKTLLIRELIDANSEVTLFTRPRRFGKTLAMSMLQTYFEKSEEDTSVYFRDKKIWECGERYRSYRGRYPVVFLTLKDVKYNDWEKTYQALTIAIQNEYRRHGELMDSERLSDNDRLYYRRVIAGQLNEVEFANALYQLTRLLYSHHGEKAIILVDEYDTPIQQGYTRHFYDSVIEFVRNLFSGGLKDNPYLAFGVLTGILRVSKENLFSGLNNPVVNTVVDEAFSDAFGFTHEEVTDILNYYGCIDKQSELQTWYDGYVFGRTQIYNPWSVMNYINNQCKPKSFWANTSENDILRSALQVLSPEDAEEMVHLLEGETITTALRMEVIYPQIGDSVSSLYSFLLISGYLKLAGNIEETPYGTYGRLAIPNVEIRRVFESEILSWISCHSGETPIANIQKALYLNDAAMLERNIRQFIEQSVSFFDASTEGFYHGMILGLLGIMSDRYMLRSNRESGEGRYDIALFPRDADMPGIIMEFKSERQIADSLQAEARNAYAQIVSKKYFADMVDAGVQTICKYGIAFYKEDVAVYTEG